MGPRHTDSTVLSRPLLALAAGVPLAVQILHRDEPLAWAAAFGVVGAALAVSVSLGRWVLAVAVAGVVGWAAIGPWPTVVLVALATAWGAVARADREATVAGGRAPVIGPLLAADILLVAREGLIAPAGLVALAGLALVITSRRPAWFATLQPRVDRVGSAIGRTLGAITMLPAAVLVVLRWVWTTVLRQDPFRRDGSGWTDRRGPDLHPERLYVDSGPSARPRRSTARTAGRVLALGVLVAGVVYLGFYRDPPGPPTSRAFADEPQFEQIWAEQQGFSRHLRFDPDSLFAFSDYRSEFVNQVDGVRTTWQPPACECPRLRVWWFGGSAAWGFYQSDLDSIPSALARAAWDAGVALEIENRALPGYTLGLEAHRFAALSASLPAPDVVIFYDGANELDFQIRRNGQGKGSDESTVSFYDDSLETVYELFGRAVRLAPNRAEGEATDEPVAGPLLDAPELAHHALNRYRRGVDLATRLAESIGARPVFVWQPTQSSVSAAADAPFDGQGEWRDEDREWFRRLVAAARSELPPQVIDLSEIFANATEPIMPDWSHTDRTGARRIAESLADRLVPSLLDETA